MRAIVEVRRVAPLWMCWIGPLIDAVAPLGRPWASAREVIPECGEEVRRADRNQFIVCRIVARNLTPRVFEGTGERASLRRRKGVTWCAACLPIRLRDAGQRASPSTRMQ
jgi:hypothetical protein